MSIQKTIRKFIEEEILSLPVHFSDKEKQKEFFQGINSLLTKLSPKYSIKENCISFRVNDSDKRVRLKTARFLTRKLNMQKILTDHQIKILADKIDLWLNPDNYTIKLYSGPEITENYRNAIGGKSCMTGSIADYTRLYEMNPNRISQAVIKFDKDSARAIVWKLDNGTFYMDRVYSNNRILKEILYRYAEKQTWKKYSTDQNTLLYVSGLDYINGYIPYMDTFMYGSITKDNKLCLCSVLKDSFIYELLQTDGYLQEIKDNLICYRCGDEIISENDPYEIVDGDVICENCLEKYYQCCDECSALCDISQMRTTSSDYRHIQSLCFECYGHYCEKQ